jgi:hypothetical protein
VVTVVCNAGIVPWTRIRGRPERWSALRRSAISIGLRSHERGETPRPPHPCIPARAGQEMSG